MFVGCCLPGVVWSEMVELQELVSIRAELFGIEGIGQDKVNSWDSEGED